MTHDMYLLNIVWNQEVWTSFHLPPNRDYSHSACICLPLGEVVVKFNETLILKLKNYFGERIANLMENSFLRTSLVLGFGGKERKKRSVEHKVHKTQQKMDRF